MERLRRLSQCRIASRRPIYSGNITLIVKEKNTKRRTSVYIELFEDCPKHYAVLYKSENLEFQYGFFDYGKCIVESVPYNECQFEIKISDSDSGLLFEAPSSELADKWMESFRCSKYCPYSPVNRKRNGVVLVKSALLCVRECN